GEPVQLHRVLADVQIRLDHHLVGAVGLPCGAWRRSDEVADAADVEEQPLRRRRDGRAAQAGDHADTAFRSGEASAWQIATASASAAWFGVGSSLSPRMTFTIRCTCAFSARP